MSDSESKRARLNAALAPGWQCGVEAVEWQPSTSKSADDQLDVSAYVAAALAKNLDKSYKMSKSVSCEQQVPSTSGNESGVKLFRESKELLRNESETDCIESHKKKAKRKLETMKPAPSSQMVQEAAVSLDWVLKDAAFTPVVHKKQKLSKHMI